MNYREFASDLPRHRTTTFTSAEENEEAMRRQGVEERHRQLGSGKIRIDLAVLETDEAFLVSDRFSKSMVMTLGPADGMVGFIFPRTASGQFLASGHDLGNDKLLVVPSGSRADVVIPGLAGTDSIAVSQARFAELAHALCRSPRFRHPHEVSAIEGDTERLYALRQAVVDLIARPELDPLGERVANVAARTMAWIGDALPGGQLDRLRPGGARHRVAKLARSYIEENYRNAIRLEDLCTVTGVGLRTLQRCFPEYFALTITDYIKTVRLEAARRHLAAADPAHDSVTRIALEHGFAHLGRFSIAFRERFGESPNETLRNRSGRRRRDGTRQCGDVGGHPRLLDPARVRAR